MPLDAQLDLKEIVRSKNVVELLDEDDRATIAEWTYEGWRMDAASRMDWETRTADAFKLALQVMEEKTFPWPGCANVKFPLITVAALQFHAKAYPALIPGPDIVQCRVFGADPDGMKNARASRVADHMSYQVLEEDESWEEQHDQVLITVPIVGCAFKKSYFDPNLGHNVSENILAQDLYLPYFARSVETASRVTQVLHLSSNDVLSKERDDLFCEGSLGTRPTNVNTSPIQVALDSRQGLQESPEDPNAPIRYLEQHRWLDLDGDGFQEPYIVTIREDNKKLVRIVARFHSADIKRNKRGEVTFIRAANYFTKYGFIPSPDGGIYDLGFGLLLGSMNETINTSLNQILDAGTMNLTAGGFLGRGAKLRSGDNAFRPFEWKRVDGQGDDLRKNVVPYPAKEPSQVLFSVLQLLINYGERVAGATDAQVGINPGQNTPAETSRNMITEGQRVFIGIFKRLHRAMKSEFRKLYLLNQIYLEDDTKYFSTASGMDKTILLADYAQSEKAICPSADPNMVTDSQRILQAQFLKQASMTTNGYNRDAVERRLLQSLRITDITQIYPGEGKVPPLPNPKVQVEQMKLQVKQLEIQANQKMAALELMNEVQLTQGKIKELETKALLNLAQAKGIQTGHEIALIEAQIGAAKAHQEGLLRAVDTLMKYQGKEGQDGQASDNGRGVPGLGSPSGNGSVPGVPGGPGAGGEGPLGTGGLGA